MALTNSVHIKLENVSKKFAQEWIFKDINLELNQGSKLVILGGNGSGKSTLLQIIAGYILPNKGKISYLKDNHTLEPEHFKNHISIATPYLELIEDFTLTELINHCSIHKKNLNNLKAQEIIHIADLEKASTKLIRDFSSGMKQRVKLTMAILSEAPILFLDEPISNLDKSSILWFKKMISDFATEKTILVCSNSIQDEFEFCKERLELTNYKKN